MNPMVRSRSMEMRWVIDTPALQAGLHRVLVDRQADYSRLSERGEDPIAGRAGAEAASRPNPVLPLLARDLLALLARLGQTDGDGLFPALHLAAFAALAALCGAALVAMHFVLKILAGTLGILPLLRHHWSPFPGK